MKKNADEISNIIVSIGLLIIAFFFKDVAYVACAFAGGYFFWDNITKIYNNR